MKRNFLLIAAVAVIAAIACQKADAPMLTVSTSSLNYGPVGGNAVFSVTSNLDWTASASEDWISLSTLSGSGNATFTVTVPEFTEASARSGQVTVKAGELQQVVAIVQVAPLAPDETIESTLKVIALGGTLSVNVPKGYSYEAVTEADWITAETANGVMTLKVAPYANGTASRTATVDAVFGEDVLVEVTVEQSYRNVEPGELLIEEVYFTGSPIEGSDRASTDQYIKLTNNSDHVIYADRVVFALNFIQGFITATGAYYEYPKEESGLVVTDMYAIPGDGDDHPLEPGESLVLALAALDYVSGYKEGETTVDGNPNAIDLSKADFEFYDENDIYPDTDNPDVANLDIWFKSSFTITSLHNRGLESYAVILPPSGEDAQSIMTNHHWTGTYHMHFNEWNFEYNIADEDAWLIPGEWVLDAVNCSLPDSWYQNPWPAAFDAGWTHAGDYDKDPARFGKSVRRKVVNGKLADTNVSTNDFTPNATPSLKK